MFCIYSDTFINILKLDSHFFYNIGLTQMLSCGIVLRKGESLFFMPKICIMEVEVMRNRITLACSECKQRNYSTTKDKKAMPDKMEIKKYCKFCKTHTLHKETK